MALVQIDKFQHLVSITELLGNPIITDTYYVYYDDATFAISAKYTRRSVKTTQGSPYNITTPLAPVGPSQLQDILPVINRIVRKYTSGQIITQFCDFPNKRKVIIRASNLTPFATVEFQNNSAECGYTEPGQPPVVPVGEGIPPNPFGSPLYNVYKFFNFCDNDTDQQIRIEVLRRGYTGSPIEIPSAGGDPVTLIYKKQDSKLFQFMPCECELNFQCLDNFTFQELYTDDERKYRVNVKENGQLKFSGYIIPDSSSEPFQSPPYNISLRATDALGGLKNITYPVPIGSNTDIRQRFVDIIAYCLAGTNLNLDIYTTVNLYESKMPNGIDNDPLRLSSVNPLRFSDDKGNIMNCYDVLEAVLKQFGCYIVQHDGAWHIIRQRELGASVIRRRLYDYTALFKRSEQLSIATNVRRFDGEGDAIFIDNDGVLNTQNGYKRATVLFEYGQASTNIFNGDFELWDGANFNFWSRYGGLDISRVQRSILDSYGVPIFVNNYAARFNSEYSATKWLESNAFFATSGDELTLSMNVGCSQLCKIYLQVQIGTYYLANKFNSDELEWRSAQATTVGYVGSKIPDINKYKATIKMPELPITGDVKVRLFGFKTYRKFLGLDVTTPYKPVTIDNVSVDIKSNKTDVDGTWYFSEQSGFYTDKPEQIEVFFGEKDEIIDSEPVRYQLLAGSQAVQAQRPALIYTSDNSPAKRWYEFGRGGQQQPIGLILARSIVNEYQRPYYIYEGSFKGNISPLSVINLQELNNRLFMFCGGEISLKYNTIRNASLHQIYSGTIPTTDNSIPHSPGQLPPPITQDPNGNGLGDSDGDKIFFPQFTNEFT